MPFVSCLDPGSCCDCCSFVDKMFMDLFLSACKLARFFVKGIWFIGLARFQGKAFLDLSCFVGALYWLLANCPKIVLQMIYCAFCTLNSYHIFTSP